MRNSILRCLLLTICTIPAARAVAQDAPPPAVKSTPENKTTLPPKATVPNAAPHAGETLLFDPKAISLLTLPNGVRGVVRETQGTGLVAVQVWVRAGSRFETTKNSGVSHLIETIAMNASKNYPRISGLGSGGSAGAIEGLGGTANSQTTRDAVNYSATVAAGFLPAAIRALSDAALQPRLTDAEVENTKLDLEADVARRGADAITATADLAYKSAFAKHPYRFPAGGSADTVARLSGGAARAFHAARYVGGNISVIIVGDVRRATANALIARHFAAAKAGKTREAIALESTPLAFKNVTRKRPAARTALALAFRAPGIASPTDVIATDVLLSHWSEGRNAALRRVLLGQGANAVPGPDDPDAEETAENTNMPEPLALGFDVNFLTQRDPGLLMFSLVVEPDKKAEAAGAILAEIGKVRANGISPGDLARAKTALQRQYLEQSDTVSGQAGALGFYEMISTYQFATSYLQRIERISNDDIKRMAGKYLASTAYVQVSIEPSPQPKSNPLGVDETVPA